MLKEKPSFFGKFSSDQNSQPPAQPQSQFSAPSQQPVSMPVYTDDETTQMPVSQMATPAPQSTWEPESEVADAEGQLTIDVYQTENDIVIHFDCASAKSRYNQDQEDSSSWLLITCYCFFFKKGSCDLFFLFILCDFSPSHSSLYLSYSLA